MNGELQTVQVDEQAGRLGHRANWTVRVGPVVGGSPYFTFYGKRDMLIDLIARLLLDQNGCDEPT